MNDGNEKKIILRENVIKEIHSIISEIKFISTNQEVKDKADLAMKMLSKEDELMNQSVEDMIYNKMKSTEDEELNVKLYMLYRKLQNSKISEEDALAQYELLCGQEYSNGYVY